LSDNNIFNFAKFAKLRTVQKKILMGVFDLWLIIISALSAFLLRVESFPNINQIFLLTVFLGSFYFSLSVLFGLYKHAVRGWSVAALKRYFLPLVYLSSINSCFFLFSLIEIPRSVGIIQSVVFSSLLVSSRWLFSLMFSEFTHKKEKLAKRMIIIYGAGVGGRHLRAAIEASELLGVFCFIDDNRELHGRFMGGKLVVSIDEAFELPGVERVSDVVFAMQELSSSRKREVIEFLASKGVNAREMPNIIEILSGRLNLDNAKLVKAEQLLSRNSVTANNDFVASAIEGRVVLVSGAGGSIGSEICITAMYRFPKDLILFDICEYSLYKIHTRISDLQRDDQSLKDINVVAVLGSIGDETLIEDVLTKYPVSQVFHAAAYKHVPILENNINSGVKNNVFSTVNFATICSRHRVENFVLISSDKAVRPTNVMGATKRVCELVLQGLSQKKSGTVFSIVRFGNVLNSSGSVIPRFEEQIRHGGPVTVTHEEITRYFMTISEAADLVIQSASLAKGGEIFLLDMGEPVLIKELAEKYIKLSGYTLRTADNQGGDIEIEITGLRPGEKLYEELLIDERAKPTTHPMIFRAEDPAMEIEALFAEIDRIEHFISINDQDATLDVLSRLAGVERLGS